MKPWIYPQTDPLAARTLAQAAGLDELCCRILLARGVDTPEAAAEFVRGGTLHDPFLMRDMERAVNAIEEVLLEGGLIVVYGDYDCDGITSTALLYRYLEERGGNVAYYIPDREDEGYGLNREACDALHQNGAKLVITVDNGVTAMVEIAYLTELGLRVVVTDHHQPRPDALPVCEAVLNPHRADDDYPFKELSGVGVAFKLVCALEGDPEGLDTLERYADLVCVGTIADVVPLRGENRVIAAAGLRRLGESELPGLRALIAAAGLHADALLAENVAFGLAPRVNAASRLGECDKSVELMLCDDDEEAARLAAEVDACNQKRRTLENEIAAEIAAQLAREPQLALARVIVLAGENWHRGVIGIVASRVMQKYGRPCLLVSTQGDEARGSARSVPGFSIIEALTECAPLLVKYGGHDMAAGFSLASADVPALRDALNLAAARRCPDMPRPSLHVDAELDPARADLGQAERLAALEPFGAGNEQPVLLLRGARIDELTAIGNGKHLRARLTAGGKPMQAVGFGLTPETFPVPAGETADLCVSLTVNEYNGARRPSLRIFDARPAGFRQEEYLGDWGAYERLRRGEGVLPGEAARLTPQREELALVYRLVRARGNVTADADALTAQLGASAPSHARVRVAVQVLLEAGLIAQEGERLALLPASGKVDLEQTALMAALRNAARPETAPVG